MVRKLIKLSLYIPASFFLWILRVKFFFMAMPEKNPTNEKIINQKTYEKKEVFKCVCEEKLSFDGQPFLSVLVPVYNGEKYILSCLNSIEESCAGIPYELVLVNDASEDTTSEIINGFTSSGNIKIITFNINQGISQARNSALNEARGEYVTFVDADDIAIGNYDKVIELIKEKKFPAIVSTDFINFTEQPTVRTPRAIVVRKTSGEELFDGVNGFAWGKFYKRNIFENIFFLPGCMWEDIIILPILCNKAVEVFLCDYVSIGYRNNPLSISRKKPTEKSAKDYIEQLHHLFSLAQSCNLNNDFFYYRLMRESGKFLYERLQHLSKNQKKAFFTEVRPLVIESRLDKNIKQLPLAEKLIDLSFQTNSFKAWEIACTYQRL